MRLSHTSDKPFSTPEIHKLKFMEEVNVDTLLLRDSKFQMLSAL